MSIEFVNVNVRRERVRGDSVAVKYDRARPTGDVRVDAVAVNVVRAPDTDANRTGVLSLQDCRVNTILKSAAWVPRASARTERRCNRSVQPGGARPSRAMSRCAVVAPVAARERVVDRRPLNARRRCDQDWSRPRPRTDDLQLSPEPLYDTRYAVVRDDVTVGTQHPPVSAAGGIDRLPTDVRSIRPSVPVRTLPVDPLDTPQPAGGDAPDVGLCSALPDGGSDEYLGEADFDGLDGDLSLMDQDTSDEDLSVAEVVETPVADHYGTASFDTLVQRLSDPDHGWMLPCFATSLFGFRVFTVFWTTVAVGFAAISFVSLENAFRCHALDLAELFTAHGPLPKRLHSASYHTVVATAAVLLRVVLGSALVAVVSCAAYADQIAQVVFRDVLPGAVTMVVLVVLMFYCLDDLSVVRPNALERASLRRFAAKKLLDLSVAYLVRRYFPGHPPAFVRPLAGAVALLVITGANRFIVNRLWCGGSSDTVVGARSRSRRRPSDTAELRALRGSVATLQGRVAALTPTVTPPTAQRRSTSRAGRPERRRSEAQPRRAPATATRARAPTAAQATRPAPRQNRSADNVRVVIARPLANKSEAFNATVRRLNADLVVDNYKEFSAVELKPYTDKLFVSDEDAYAECQPLRVFVDKTYAAGNDGTTTLRFVCYLSAVQYQSVAVAKACSAITMATDRHAILKFEPAVTLRSNSVKRDEFVVVVIVAAFAKAVPLSIYRDVANHRINSVVFHLQRWSQSKMGSFERKLVASEAAYADTVGKIDADYDDLPDYSIGKSPVAPEIIYTGRLPEQFVSAFNSEGGYVLRESRDNLGKHNDHATAYVYRTKHRRVVSKLLESVPGVGYFSSRGPSIPNGTVTSLHDYPLLTEEDVLRVECSLRGFLSTVHRNRSNATYVVAVAAYCSRLAAASYPLEAGRLRVTAELSADRRFRWLRGKPLFHRGATVVIDHCAYYFSPASVFTAAAAAGVARLVVTYHEDKLCPLVQDWECLTTGLRCQTVGDTMRFYFAGVDGKVYASSKRVYQQWCWLPDVTRCHGVTVLRQLVARDGSMVTYTFDFVDNPASAYRCSTNVPTSGGAWLISKKFFLSIRRYTTAAVRVDAEVFNKFSSVARSVDTEGTTRDRRNLLNIYRSFQYRVRVGNGVIGSVERLAVDDSPEVLDMFERFVFDKRVIYRCRCADVLYWVRRVFVGTSDVTRDGAVYTRGTAERPLLRSVERTLDDPFDDSVLYVDAKSLAPTSCTPIAPPSTDPFQPRSDSNLTSAVAWRLVPLLRSVLDLCSSVIDDWVALPDFVASAPDHLRVSLPRDFLDRNLSLLDRLFTGASMRRFDDRNSHVEAKFARKRFDGGCAFTSFRRLPPVFDGDADRPVTFASKWLYTWRVSMEMLAGDSVTVFDLLGAQDVVVGSSCDPAINSAVYYMECYTLAKRGLQESLVDYSEWFVAAVLRHYTPPFVISSHVCDRVQYLISAFAEYLAAEYMVTVLRHVEYMDNLSDKFDVQPFTYRHLRPSYVDTLTCRVLPLHEVLERLGTAAAGASYGDRFVSSSELNPFHAALQADGLRRRLGNVYRLRLDSVLLIQGAAGCGKTTAIRKLVAERPGALLLVATTENAAEMKACGAVTITSYLQNYRVCESPQLLVIDEAMMVHPGLLLLVIATVNADRVVCFGDKHQIPFVLRNTMVDDLKYTVFDFGCEEVLCNVTYRMPADVAFLMRHVYGQGLLTCNTTVKSMRSVLSNQPVVTLRHYGSLIHARGTQVICMNQSTKRVLLESDRDLNVMTVHESQGLTFQHVFMVRDVIHNMPIFDPVNGAPNAWMVVALTRHNTSFTYITAVPDYLHRVIDAESRLDAATIQRAYSADASTDWLVSDIVARLPALVPAGRTLEFCQSRADAYATIVDHLNSDGDTRASFDALTAATTLSTAWFVEPRDLDMDAVASNNYNRYALARRKSADYPVYTPLRRLSWASAWSTTDGFDLHAPPRRPRGVPDVVDAALAADVMRASYADQSPSSMRKKIMLNYVSLVFRKLGVVGRVDFAYTYRGRSCSEWVYSVDCDDVRGTLSALFDMRVGHLCLSIRDTTLCVNNAVLNFVSDCAAVNLNTCEASAIVVPQAGLEHFCLSVGRVFYTRGDSAPALYQMFTAGDLSDCWYVALRPLIRHYVSSFVEARLWLGVKKFHAPTLISVLKRVAYKMRLTLSSRLDTPNDSTLYLARRAADLPRALNFVVCCFVYPGHMQRVGKMERHNLVVACMHSSMLRDNRAAVAVALEVADQVDSSANIGHFAERQLTSGADPRDKAALCEVYRDAQLRPYDEVFVPQVLDSAADLSVDRSVTVCDQGPLNAVLLQAVYDDCVHPAPKMADTYNRATQDKWFPGHIEAQGVTFVDTSVVPTATSGEIKVHPKLNTSYYGKLDNSVTTVLDAVTKRNLNVPVLQGNAVASVFSRKHVARFLEVCTCGVDAFRDLPYISGGGVTFETWAANLPSGKSAQLLDVEPDITRHDGNVYDLILKPGTKATGTNKADVETPKGQVIAAIDKRFNLHFSPIFRVMMTRVLQTLNPEVVFGTRRDIGAMNAIINSRLRDVTAADLYFYELDLSSYDKSINASMFATFERLMGVYGVHPDDIALWRTIHRHPKTKSQTKISFWRDYQTLSGDSATALSNSLLNMVICKELVNLAVCSLLFGDDSLFVTDRPLSDRTLLEMSDRLARHYNVEAKVVKRDGAGYFCGFYLCYADGIWKFVPDLIKRLEKLGTTAFKSLDEVREAAVSYAGIFSHFDSWSHNRLVSDVLIRTYGMSVDPIAAFEELFRTAACPSLLVTLFDEPAGGTVVRREGSALRSAVCLSVFAAAVWWLNAWGGR